MSQTIKTVVDRIEGDLLVCSDDNTSAERTLSHTLYPHLKPNDVLLLTLDGDEILSVELLGEETEARTKRARERLNKLFARRRS